MKVILCLSSILPIMIYSSLSLNMGYSQFGFGQDQMKIFSSDVDKDLIAVPKDWVTRNIDGKQLFYDPQNRELIITVSRYAPAIGTPFSSTDASVQDVVDKIIKDMPPTIDILSNKYDDALKGQDFAYTFNMEGTPYFQDRIYIISDGSLYEYTATCPASAAKGYVDLMTTISSSFVVGEAYDELQAKFKATG